MAIIDKKPEVDFSDLDRFNSKSIGIKQGTKKTEGVDWSDMGKDVDSFKQSIHPEGENLFFKFDKVIKAAGKEMEGHPFTLAGTKGAINALPGLDNVTKNNLMSGDTSMFKEIYGIPALHMANQALFNYPRSAINKGGYRIPQSQTAPGGALANAAGVTGALMPFSAGFGASAASKAVPFKALAGRSMARESARGAIVGGLQGAVYSPDDPLDMKARGIQAAGGFFLGGLAGGISNRVSALTKSWKRVQRRGGIKQPSTLRGRVKTGRIKGDALRGQEELASKRFYSEADNLLKTNADELRNSVSRQQVSGKVPEVEQAFTAWRRNLNDIYEAGIGDVADTIGDVSKKDTYEFFMPLVDEIRSDPDLIRTASGAKIRGFVRKLKPTKVDTGVLNKSGDTITREASETIGFEELNAMRKSLLKRKFRGDLDDSVNGMFRKKFGDFTANLDPSGKFVELNKTMAPQLEFKHKFIRQTAAYDQYKTSGVEGLLRKYTDPTLDITLGEVRLMNDTMGYLGQFGLNADDLVRAGKKKAATKAGIKTTESVRSKLSRAAEVEGEKLAVAGKQKTKIRGLQDIKIDKITNNRLVRQGARLLDMGIRITIARYILQAISKIKGNDGVPETAR